MSLETAQNTVPPNRYRRKKGWFRHKLFRSASAAQLLAIPYAMFMPVLVIVVMSPIENPSRAEFAAITALICGISYLACARLALGVLEFGAEIEILSLYRVQRLWRLGVRRLLFPLVLILVIAPALMGYMVPSDFMRQWQLGLAVGLNCFALQLLFCLVAIMNRVGATPFPVRVFLFYAIFPFRFIGLIFSFGIVTVWIGFMVMQASWRLWGEQVFGTLDAGLQWLTQIDAVGPFLVYIINPFYQLSDIVVKNPEQPDWSALLSFGGVTALFAGVLAARLHRVLFGDWTAGRAEAYDQWLAMRGELLSDILRVQPEEQRAETYANDHAEADASEFSNIEVDWGLANSDSAPETELATPTEPTESTDTKRASDANALLYKLPAGMTGEQFIASLDSKKPLLNRTEIYVLLIGAGGLAIFGKGMYFFLLPLWYVISSAYFLPFAYHSWITPQNPWCYIGMTIRRYWPLCAGDFVMAGIAWFLLPMHWWGLLGLVAAFIGFRLLIFAARIAYKLQLAMAFFPILVGGFIYLMLVSLAFAQPEFTFQDHLLSCLGAFGSLAIVWLILAWCIWARRSNLVHYQPDRKF